jgi:hypothetical protein
MNREAASDAADMLITSGVAVTECRVALPTPSNKVPRNNHLGVAQSPKQLRGASEIVSPAPAESNNLVRVTPTSHGGARAATGRFYIVAANGRIYISNGTYLWGASRRFCLTLRLSRIKRSMLAHRDSFCILGRAVIKKTNPSAEHTAHFRRARCSSRDLSISAWLNTGYTWTQARRAPLLTRSWPRWPTGEGGSVLAPFVGHPMAT